MVIMINSVISGFRWVDLPWLAASAVRLHCPITLSGYNCTEWLLKYKAADAPMTFEEIVMVMIKRIRNLITISTR